MEMVLLVSSEELDDLELSVEQEALEVQPVLVVLPMREGLSGLTLVLFRIYPMLLGMSVLLEVQLALLDYEVLVESVVWYQALRLLLEVPEVLVLPEVLPMPED